MVKGRAVDVTSADERSRLASMPLTIWTAGVKDHWVRIRPAEVTGRRIHSIATPQFGEPCKEPGS